MAIKYSNIFQSKAIQNLPKLGLLVWKQTIWQPCTGSDLEGDRRAGKIAAERKLALKSFGSCCPNLGPELYYQPLYSPQFEISEMVDV
jgi:hypothetical protein